MNNERISALALEILPTLEKIKMSFLEFENVTIAILSCGLDDIAAMTEKREELKNKISSLYEEIDGSCEGFENSQILISAVHCKCDREEVPKEFHAVYDKAIQIISVARRIRETDGQIFERITGERDKVLELIKAENASQGALASKFVTNVANAKKPYFPENKKGI